MDNVPFSVEIDCSVWLPWSVLIDIQKVSMLAIEIRRASASLVAGVSRENVVSQFRPEGICSRSRGLCRASLRLRFPCAYQKLQRFPGIGRWRYRGRILYAKAGGAKESYNNKFVDHGSCPFTCAENPRILAST